MDINWRFFKYSWKSWKKTLKGNWKNEGVWAFVAFIFTYILEASFLGIKEMLTDIRLAGIAILGAIFTYVIRFLWIALNSPFSILKGQDGIISGFEKVTNRDTIIAGLRTLWTDGTGLRNAGEGLMHESRIDQWWGEFRQWKDKTRDAMSILDPNLASKWWTLNLFQTVRAFPNALNSDHAKKLQMFDAWLIKLDECIDILSGQSIGKHYEETPVSKYSAS